VVSLDILSPDEAAALLVRLASRPGLGAGDTPVREITRLGGYLPLAIGMLASQLRHHPAWTAVSLAAELADARDRLALMHTENLSAGAAFGLSYQDLPDDQQRLFRRLGLVPGADFDVYAAAALGATSLATARQHLDELYEHHLLAEPAPGRYQPHDLIREHARTVAATDDPADSDAGGSAPWKDSATATCRTATPAKAPPTCSRHSRSTSASAPPPHGASSKPSRTTRWHPPPRSPSRQPPAAQTISRAPPLHPRKPVGSGSEDAQMFQF
jgi:hypothetical protein